MGRTLSNTPTASSAAASLAPVERSSWIRVADNAAEPSALMMHLRNGFQSEGGAGFLHHPEFMYEKFTQTGAETTTWYRVRLRGCVSKDAALTQNEALIRFGAALKPQRNQMFGLNVYDSDGSPSYAYTIPFRTNTTGDDQDLRCYYVTSDQGNTTSNFVDLSAVAYDTLPTTS
jgi:hypothetical protein